MAIIYLVREFVMEWRVMIETVNAFLGLTIEIFPINMPDDDTTSLPHNSPSPSPSPSTPPTPTLQAHLLHINEENKSAV